MKYALATAALLAFVVSTSGQVPSQPVTPTPAPAAARAEPERATLTIGSDAPPLKVMKWFKGTPVTELKAGQVYVLEFWATWCGPCIAAMPHVTEMAKKYEGKATIIGVSVWERPAEKTDAGIEALVAPFVEKQGDRMVYNVAAEGADGYMAEHWLKAAGQDGIPCTMIIGKDHKIAWIGHPMEMEKPLEAIIAGTFDVKAEAERMRAEQAKQAELAAILQPISTALKAKDPGATVKAVDAALVKLPDMEPMLFPVKFEALIQTDEAAAFAFLRQEFDSGKLLEKEPANGYNAYIGLSRHLDAVKKPDWALMAQVLAKVNSIRGNKDPQIMAAAADAYFHTGDKAKAEDYQQKAIELAGNGAMPATWTETQQKKLEEYKAAR